MLQKKYTFQTLDELNRICTQISGSDSYRTASGILLQFNNPRLDTDDDKIMDIIREKCGKACLIGITSANIADQEFDISDHPAELNVTYFRTTRLTKYDFDMTQMTGFVAGRVLNEHLQQLPDTKCMMVCYSCGSAVIHAFYEEFSHHKLPMFGAKAGRSIRALNTARVYGSTARANGITAILFSGADLRFYMDNCLGFKEIGVEMTVTQTRGDHIITEIDHKPAVDVYSKYLNVRPNRYFVQNVCEFPLVFHRRNCVISRVPSACGEDGSIHFTSDVVKGEHFRLSYGNPDHLLRIVDQSAENLRAFRPEAVFLFECGNRVRFLKEAAHQDTAGYRSLFPELSVAVGYAELFFSSTGDGGALNSALVAVGLTEDASAKNTVRTCLNVIRDTPAPEHESAYVPFVDRILHFLETTSGELDSLNRELGRIAHTDQLTRIYNRWELERKLNEILQLRKSDHAPAALIFMDIDHFKRINDTFGHDVGDMVLRATVDLIKENLQPKHVFGRWGGEEFIYALPDTSLPEAMAFAEKLRAKIEENCYVTVRHITMSFGVTAVSDTDSPETFVKRADEALYQAKEGGRNRVIGI
ncbi:diguanylate cyclase (GGDEF) domain-containing protein [[Clostridium] aminophilum]|uniref:Diguanylate cyclase (GGDEF) domain-containing protein n=1 Tax=[Clostridium] aminophilum TaxID=1526 RepID=A0A1I0A7H3_9FIRM|nr:diguanylate cyclase [[Clostridium] aminophilum]SES89633.1 diguanylate cyclase (GGDEF) domain-containing protein [[Clostridium] aminophilum]